MQYTCGMRVSEIEVNKRFTIMVNDREHKDFKRECLEQNIDMAAVLRQCMRDYVKKAKKKK